jgi:hypothetical protein
VETADKMKILREIYEKDKEIDKIRNLEKKVPEQILEFENELKFFKDKFEK